MLKSRRISAAALAGLLALSLFPARGRADQGPKNVVFLAARDTAGAEKLVQRLEQAVHDDLIWMDWYAIVERDARGHLAVQEEWEKAPGKKLPPGFGAGVIGLAAALGGVVGLLFERGEYAGIGFISGSAVAPTRKPDWPEAPSVWPEEFNDDVSRLAHGVQPGQSALIAVIEERLPPGGAVDFDKLRARQQLEREIPVLKTAR